MSIECTVCGREVYNDHNLNTFNTTSYTNECEYCMLARRRKKKEEEEKKKEEEE